MKRVGLALIIGVAWALPAPASADCASDMAALQARLAKVQDSKRREEARLLIEKAVLDQQRGRNDLCEAATQRAGKLIN